MNIDLLDKLIKEDKTEDFKLAYKNLTLNLHHKKLLFEKCFLSGNSNLIEYMNNQISLNNEQTTNILIEILKKPLNFKILKYFDKLSDTDIVNKVDNFVIESLFVYQTNEVFNWFLDKFPLTLFKNFKPLVYSAIRNDRYELIRELNKQKLDTSTCFYFCLCFCEYKKIDSINDFLKDQTLVNPKIINELKNNQEKLFNEYLHAKKLRERRLLAFQASLASNPKKYGNLANTNTILITPKEELVNSFLESSLAKALNDYLEQKFPSKTNEKAVKKTKI